MSAEYEGEELPHDLPGSYIEPEQHLAVCLRHYVNRPSLAIPDVCELTLSYLLTHAS